VTLCASFAKLRAPKKTKEPKEPKKQKNQETAVIFSPQPNHLSTLVPQHLSTSKKLCVPKKTKQKNQIIKEILTPQDAIPPSVGMTNLRNKVLLIPTFKNFSNPKV
jgi:hypothetical protein